jgi:peroxiredoxin
MRSLKRAIGAAVLSMTLLAGASSVQAQDQVQIGDIIPMMSYKMTDISGAKLNLRELNQENGLLVIFSCNTCPFVIQWEDRYNELYDLCAANDIGMVLVNSNEAKRDGEDSFEKMQEKAEKEGYKMHYVVDEKHQLADAFGATTTPHIFLFNRDAKLAYRGLIDDNGKEKEAVTQPYLKNAIKAMIANDKIDPEVTKSIGCSIKREL